MHPYEMASVMRQRGLSNSIKLNTGSLYSVVEALQRHQLIVPVETQKEGRHPERTVYAPTEEGRTEFMDWLRSLLRVPKKEYTHFAAGLAFIAHLPPQEALKLLEDRAEQRLQEIQKMRNAVEETKKMGVDRLFLIEEEYNLLIMETELSWLRQFMEDVRNGTLTEWQKGQMVWKISHPEFVDGEKTNMAGK